MDEISETSEREQMARAIARYVSGGLEAVPEDDDYEMADEFFQIIEGRLYGGVKG